jgi:glycogen debranching enzyme
MTPDLFNGWGVRTVASDASFYNPMSYHNGTVWPHDCSIVAAGLARYGMSKGAAELPPKQDVTLHVNGVARSLSIRP